jgi:hypothetical protein
MDRRAHWQDVYAAHASDTLSWFQATPRASLALLERAGVHADT